MTAARRSPLVERGRLNPDVLIDLVYGGLYYRLLLGHLPLDETLGRRLVSAALN